MTCSVPGSYPNVTKVIFGCGGQRETSVGTSNTISITANASMDGQNCTCSAVWKNKPTDWYPLTADVFLTVYYGPQSVSLTSPDIIDLHPIMSGNVTLTCNATVYKPSVTYTWSGACSAFSGSTCSLVPTENNNGNVITCTAINTAFNSLRSSNRTMVIHYPPRGAPIIKGYTTGEVLFDGQTRNITCNVIGGNPPVTSVTFGCGDQNMTANDTSNTIRVTADSSKDGQNCRCSAVWKNKTTDWYPLTTDVRLTVYYAPKPPFIGHTAAPFPFLAGDTTTLTCSLPDADSGNPPAMLHWQGGQESWSLGQISMGLTLNSSHNGKKVECEATNNFTVYNNTKVTASFLLQVYYISTVELQSLAYNSCETVSGSCCVVEEGQRVQVNCSSSSNPSLASVEWQTTGTSVLDLIAHRSLAIEHVCKVNTTVINNDTRLPLKASRGLNICTQYAGMLREFVVNGHADNLTVNETKVVRVTCTADGRPSPALTILTDGVRVAHQPEGQPVSVQDVVSLQYDIPHAQCLHSGIYTCHTGNGTTITRTLTVLCGPKFTLSETKPKEVFNYIGFPLSFNFSVVANPAPTFEIIYNGPSNSLTQAVTKDKLNVTCWEQRDTYNFFCIATVDKIQAEDAGYYSLKMENRLGVQQLNFQVTFYAVSERTSSTNIPAVIGGVIAGLVAAIAVIAVVAFWYRRKKKGHSHQRKRKSGEIQLSNGNTTNSMSETEENANQGYSDAIEASHSTAAASAYDVLDLRDIGKPSEYTVFSPYENTGLSKGEPAKGEIVYLNTSPENFEKEPDASYSHAYQNFTSLQ